MLIYPCHHVKHLHFIVKSIFHVKIINNVYIAYSALTQETHKNYTSQIKHSNNKHTQLHYTKTHKKTILRNKIGYISISILLHTKMNNYSKSIKTIDVPQHSHTVTKLNKNG